MSKLDVAIYVRMYVWMYLCMYQCMLGWILDSLQVQVLGNFSLIYSVPPHLILLLYGLYIPFVQYFQLQCQTGENDNNNLSI